METPSENRKMVSYIDTPFSDLFSDGEMASFPWVQDRFRKPETSKNFPPFSDASVGRRETERRILKPQPFSPTPRSRDNHPFLLSLAIRQNGSLSRNVCSTGSGLNPQAHPSSRVWVVGPLFVPIRARQLPSPCRRPSPDIKIAKDRPVYLILN
jgi:hypothetical protein